MDNNIFKSYDIRGIYPTEIDEAGVFKIAQAFARVVKPKTVALGKDVRLSSPALFESAKDGLLKSGVNVVDIGTISTDMLYFAVANYGYDGGITITASHNPKEYNGMKLVGKDSAPIFSDFLLLEIQKIACDPEFKPIEIPGGECSKKEILPNYLTKVKSFGSLENLKPIKILLNANFGLAGKIFKQILEGTATEIVELNCEPDGSFPKGRPDPLVPENREETKAKIKETGSRLGFAWDADADRCFVYDENGNDIEGCFMGALLAKIILERSPGKNENLVYDPRIVWTLAETIKESGGVPIPSRVGHAIIKAKMREVNALAALESSGHFYFRDFFYCDNGMISAIMILSYLNEKGLTLSQALAEIMSKYFVSGEINFTAENKDEIIAQLKEKYADAKFEEIDGISIEYPDWRFNVRKSNTEPLLRLNIETRSQALLDEKKKELVELIDGWKK
ncbi:MAG: phosphomannomutase/phosphoglucomutase [Candidatus Moraniibacteriota bacterium]